MTQDFTLYQIKAQKVYEAAAAYNEAVKEADKIGIRVSRKSDGLDYDATIQVQVSIPIFPIKTPGEE